MNRSLLKTKLITNSLLELGLEEDEGKGKGRYFVSKFIEAGLAHYKELGDILITKETLDKFIQTMVGCPVIIDHEDVNDKNVDKLRVGVISRVWYNEMDGWYYCEGILTDSEAIDLVKNKGWSVSCSYSFVSDETQKTYHGKPIDMEFTDGEFLHLAIVETPRYEGANIVVNKKDDDVEWITVKGNHIPVKKGQSKDEAVKEFLESKQSKSEVKTDKRYYYDFTEKEKTFIDENEKNGNIVYKNYPQGELIALDPKTNIYTDINGDRKEETAVYKEKLKPVTLSKQKSEDKERLGPDKSYVIMKRINPKSGKTIYHTKGIMDHEKAMDMDSEDLIPLIYKTKKDYLDAIKRFKESNANIFGEDTEYKTENKKEKINNNIGDTTMTVLNDLTDFIKKVVKNEKDEEMKEVKNEDKRKLIDEVGGILKGKVDEEVWRTVVGKLEKVAYEPSEDDKADNKKAKNEDDDKEKTENKCKNEDEKDKKVEDEEDKKEKEEDPTKNEDEDKEDKKEVKNSMKDFVMGGSNKVEEKSLYTSRAKRLEEGNKY